MLRLSTRIGEVVILPQINTWKWKSLSPVDSEKKRTEVLILCQLFYPELVSTGQTLTELAEELVSQGVDVEVLCGPPTIVSRKKKTPRQMEYRGVRIRRVWGTRFPKLSLAGRIANQLSFACSVFLYLLIHRPQRPILVLTNPPFLAIGCALLRRLKLIGPYMYLVFDVYPDTAVRLGLLREGAWLTRLWDRLNLAAYRQASFIIVIGRCMARVIARKMQEGGLALNGELRHIPVWCDDESIRSVRSRDTGLAKQFNVEGKFVVGYFGNMGRFHDMETIMAAAELLKDERDVVFLFVGDGHKKQWARQWARERGLENCRFHSYVPREKLGQLLSLAHLGLVSLVEGQEGLSVPSKTFGLMAAGVPVLAVMPAVSEIARMIEEVNCGVCIRPGDVQRLAATIIGFKHDRNEASRLGANGKTAIDKQYNLKNAACQYADLLRSVATKTQAPGACATLTGAMASQGGSVVSPLSITESRTVTGQDQRQPELTGNR